MDCMPSIPDDVLELILLRLASPRHLIHAASTSKRWHRLIAGDGFLRRFASVNRQQLVAGSYYDSSIIPAVNRPSPVFIPSPSTAIDGSRFSLDFLWSDDMCSFDPLCWTISDSRGSLLLLSFNTYEEDCSSWSLRVVVCEPFTRRYTIVAPLERSEIWAIHTGPFFLDAGDDLSSFGLVCVLCDRFYDRNRHRAVTFTSSEHRSWRESSIDRESMSFMGRTRSALYWHVGESTVAAMDRRTAEFTSSRLPNTEEDYWKGHRVVAGRDCEARIVVDGAGGTLKFFAKSQASRSQWDLEKIIHLYNVLPGCDRSYFSGHRDACIQVTVTDTALIVIELQVGERLVTDTGLNVINLQHGLSLAYCLDVETMEAKRVSEVAFKDVAFPCELPWPPTFHASTELLHV
ncbi:hypothetical protein EJB05_01542, partial [Eragrostis curvula]